MPRCGLNGEGIALADRLIGKVASNARRMSEFAPTQLLDPGIAPVHPYIGHGYWSFDLVTNGDDRRTVGSVASAGARATDIYLCALLGGGSLLEVAAGRWVKASANGNGWVGVFVNGVSMGSWNEVGCSWGRRPKRLRVLLGCGETDELALPSVVSGRSSLALENEPRIRCPLSMRERLTDFLVTVARLVTLGHGIAKPPLRGPLLESPLAPGRSISDEKVWVLMGLALALRMHYYAFDFWRAD